MNGYDWESAAEGNASLSDGYHCVKCVKVMRANKDGKPYTSQAGDPQLYTVWQNDSEDESLAIFTLSPKAAFVLAGMLKASGADLKRMQDAGVTPDDFADLMFAEKQLIGRVCWVYAERKGKHVNLDFVEKDTVPDNAMRSYNANSEPDAKREYIPADKTHEAVTEDDIPF